LKINDFCRGFLFNIKTYLMPYLFRVSFCSFRYTKSLCIGISSHWVEVLGKGLKWFIINSEKPIKRNVSSITTLSM